MLSAKKINFVDDCIAASLILLFFYTAINKLSDLQLFRIQLGKSPLLNSFAGLLSLAVPICELSVALLLLFRSTRLAGFYLSLFLMILFTAYILIILNFSYYIPCACGGILEGLSWSGHVVLNSLFVGLIIIGIVIQSKQKIQT